MFSKDQRQIKCTIIIRCFNVVRLFYLRPVAGGGAGKLVPQTILAVGYCFPG